jgi:hypothetical protein
MIRTFKPPPRVVVPPDVRPPPKQAAYDDSFEAEVEQQMRLISAQRGMVTSAEEEPTSNVDDFEAAVRAEMRKMEEDLQRQVAVQAAPDLHSRQEHANRDTYYDEPKSRHAAPPASHPKPDPFQILVSNERNGFFEAVSPTKAAVPVLGSPARRKGGAISQMYGDQDNRMNTKAAKAAEYSAFLQQQVMNII